MQRLVILVLSLLPALAGSVAAGRTDPAGDGISTAPWLDQLQQPYTGSSSFAPQQTDSRPTAVQGMLQHLQHAAGAAVRAVSQGMAVTARDSMAPSTESRDSTRVMRRHFVNDTDPSALCNDGTPGTSQVEVIAFCAACCAGRGLSLGGHLDLWRVCKWLFTSVA